MTIVNLNKIKITRGEIYLMNKQIDLSFFPGLDQPTDSISSRF